MITFCKRLPFMIIRVYKKHLVLRAAWYYCTNIGVVNCNCKRRHRTEVSRCHQFSRLQWTILHKRSSHAIFVKRIWTYVNIKYLCTIVDDFVCLFHPKPVQIIITIKPPRMYLQWRHLFSAVGRIWQREINKFTKCLSVSS